MLKLYKQINNEIHYWETWNTKDGTGIIHWGIIGDQGQDKEVKSNPSFSFKDQIQREIDIKISEGFKPVDLDEHYTLLIEYQIAEMEIVENLEKRNRLEERMDNTLGWTGLGRCDGGSIGSGTMEVCCYVIDFEVAKKVIEQDLKKTEFSDYLRIFDENE